MKIRTDYVTNSSSSSFILARKEELSEAQKEAVLGYVARKMLGNAILTPSSSEEEIQKTFDDFYISEENQAAIRQALADGKTVYRGCVNFECCEETQAELFERLWEALEDADPDTFSILDGDLDKIGRASCRERV